MVIGTDLCTPLFSHQVSSCTRVMPFPSQSPAKVSAPGFPTCPLERLHGSFSPAPLALRLNPGNRWNSPSPRQEPQGSEATEEEEAGCVSAL